MFEKHEKYKILSKIKQPSDLKALTTSELTDLCSEIRRKILNVVATNGGHLASNLGVVELTVALHKLFDSPNDKIIWDVGHQCYAHKLLTGRLKQFSTLRQEGGVSGFPKPKESEHDIAIVGHASTSISLACGLAKSELLNKTKNKIIAVIGDGALTGGLAYEGLNNGINLNNLIIILNYNDMSIAKTAGSLPRYVSKIRSQQAYISTSTLIDNFLKKIPFMGSSLIKLTLHFKNALKKIIYKPNFLSGMGYLFLSPVNGHSLKELTKALNWAKQQNGPSVIQVITKKGYGYSKAEKNPELYHGVGPFDLNKGIKKNTHCVCFSSVFGEEICNLAKSDRRICIITAAMEDGTGVVPFKKKFPERFFDVGIAESHAVTFAAGLSTNKMLPVFAIYSTFLQRSYDQILHDVAINNGHLVLAIDRAGLIGGDGETHQGLFDCAFLSSIPNVKIFAPTSYLELKKYLIKALYYEKGIVAIRYSKGKQIKFLANCTQFKTDSSKNFSVLGKSKKTVIVTYGNLTWQAVLARNKLIKEHSFEIAVVKLNKLHPIETELINQLKQYCEVFFFEEGIKNGGIGEHVLCELIKNNFKKQVSLIAIENVFVSHLNIETALKKLKLDSDSMVEKIVNCSKHFKIKKRRIL